TLDQHVGYSQNNRPLSNGIYGALLPVAEAEASLRYSLGARVTLSASGGWRWADAPSLKDSAGTPYDDDLHLWEYGTKAPVNVDYSGVTAQGAVSVSF
ncbi:MAG TPA: hypothetical protein VNZ54_07745, partial [bacterium]|nr:hypothetical protein [bacterium]